MSGCPLRSHAIGAALVLLLGSTLSAPQAQETRPAVLTEAEYGKTVAERLLYFRLAGKLASLHYYVQKHGKLPAKVGEFESLAHEHEPSHREDSWYWLYLLMQDRWPEYRFTYRSDRPEAPFELLPREPDSELYTLVLEADGEARVTAGRTAGQSADQGLRDLPIFDLLASAKRCEPGFTSEELVVLLSVWDFERAQQTHSLLNGGKPASQVEALTKPIAPAKLPLFDPALFHGYPTRFTAGERGWTLEVAPEPAAAEAAPSESEGIRYKFRVGLGVPLSFAPAANADSWRAVADLRCR